MGRTGADMGEKYLSSKIDVDLKNEKKACMTGARMHHGLERAAGRLCDRVAVRLGDENWSFADLDGQANAMARHLRDGGVACGDRVAVMLANRVELIVAVNAISKLGAAAVMLSPAWQAVEVGHAISLTAPVHAVADGAAAAPLGESPGEIGTA